MIPLRNSRNDCASIQMLQGYADQMRGKVRWTAWVLDSIGMDCAVIQGWRGASRLEQAATLMTAIE